MLFEKITSIHNPGVKRVARLRVKKGRDARGLTVVEGAREVRQAVAAGVRVSAVYFCQDGIYRCPQELVDDLAAKNIRMYDTNCTVFGKMSYGDRKEGVLAIVEPGELTLDDLKLSASPFVVVMEKVEKPGNLGAVLRTCDAAGVDALLVTDAMTDIHNPNVIRASLGAVFSVQTVSCTNEEALAFLRRKGIRTIAAVVQADGSYDERDLTGATAFVFGSEQEGLSPFWMKNAESKVRIPMNGKIDSLNVSVSAGIMIYEAIRQRRPAITPP